MFFPRLVFGQNESLYTFMNNSNWNSLTPYDRMRVALLSLIFPTTTWPQGSRRTLARPSPSLPMSLSLFPSIYLLLRVSPSPLSETSPLEDWRAFGCALDLLAKCWYRTGGHLRVNKLWVIGIGFKISRQEFDREGKAGINYVSWKKYSFWCYIFLTLALELYICICVEQQMTNFRYTLIFIFLLATFNQ